MLLFCLMGLFQEYYYVDGIEFLLSDGTIIKTLADVEEDNFNYRFKEGTELIVIPKNRVGSMDYFAFRLLGRRPPKKYENIHQRRIAGLSIIFERNGKQHLKFRHTDHHGRNMEGKVYQNILRFLWLETSGDDSTTFSYRIDRVHPGRILQVTFYTFEGKPISRANIKTGDKESKSSEGSFDIRHVIELNKVGLVEVAVLPADQK